MTLQPSTHKYDVQRGNDLDVKHLFSLDLDLNLPRERSTSVWECQHSAAKPVLKDDRTNCLWYSFCPASSIAAISASVSLGASNVLRYSTRRDSFVVVLEQFVNRSAHISCNSFDDYSRHYHNTLLALPQKQRLTLTEWLSRCVGQPLRDGRQHGVERPATEAENRRESAV
jgi:hypothetical protein